ncbi:CbiM family transporter [Zavarzinella formosa]|uniref:CbiM family transporter n=1 Tax=Zavarzinella formosa TaxID=360055 RepID=UPI0003114CC0|nr:energy-coupling factor ABC transporter permease [Zavarzinella formosa]
MVSLFAVHLSDFLLDTPWWVGGWIVAGLLLAWSCYRFPEQEIPQTALLTAAFFISSSIHLKFGRTSVHLLLNGLVGTMLGRRTPVAIMIGLVLQAVLLQHGGFLVLGLNAVVMSVPGLLVPRLFRFLLRPPLSGGRAFAYGWLTGSLTVLATILIHAGVLIAGGIEDLQLLAATGFLLHLPLALIEGVMLATVCQYLAVVKPELLRVKPAAKN